MSNARGHIQTYRGASFWLCTTEEGTTAHNICDQQDGLSNTRNDNEWATSIQTTHKIDTLYKEGFKILTIVNGRIVKSEVRNCARKEEKATKRQCIKFLKTNHKVLIIGDSHLKGSATKTNQFLNTKFSVSSFIKPGATINKLVSSQEKELKDLGKKDVIVLSGGANDMDNINEDKGSEVLAKMTKFMQTYNNTNIAKISIPHRFDLHNESRTNLAIQKINSKLKKMTKLFRHVSMIEMESNRNDYTKHGLHLNNARKEGLARSIANLINQIVLRENKEKQVITLNWKEEVNMDISVQMSPEQHKHRHLEVTDIISNRTSTRPKKTTYYKEK